MAERRQPSGPTRVFMTLFFGVFLLAGVGFFAAVVPASVRHAGTYFWDRVPCTMVESRVVHEATVEGEPPGWYVRFAYTIDGRRYEGFRLNVNEAAGDAREDLCRSQQLAPGVETTCLVHPGDPSVAVLERQGVSVLFVPLFPLVFVAIGGGGLWVAWRRPAPEPRSGFTARTGAHTREERIGRRVGLAFGGIFLLVGLGLTHVLFLRPVFALIGAGDWTEVPCEIVASTVASHDTDDGTTYSVELTYRYVVDGRSYLSNRYRFTAVSTGDYADAAAVVEQCPPGTPATCFVDPHDPTDAVFDRSWSGSLGFGLIPLVFALAGGGLLFGILRQGRGVRAASGVRRGRWIDRTRTPAAGAPAAAGASGPVVLTPVTSRGMKLLGLVLAALFWNGIVSVFLVSLFDESGGGINWFLALFLTPFVLVGIGLIGVALRQFLALSNPVPRLTINSRVLAPGATLELTWAIRGRVRALRRLRIELEGREEATYRRGTDTSTDREVFATFPLADTADPAAMAAGRAVLRLPSRLMHSFTARNNRIVWALQVRGEIPRWPDIEDAFEIEIVPVEDARHA